MHPTLYQVNARILLTELRQRTDRAATLDDVADEELDRWRERGFDLIYLLGVWQSGPVGREISRTLGELREGYRAVLPDVRDEDVSGSPFAVQTYHAHADFGGDAALTRFRRRLNERGLRLILDFVPNHSAIDSPWVAEHPEYYVAGSETDLHDEAHAWLRVAGRDGMRILAHGRDPYFPAWIDTLQLNYRHAGLREAMITELLRIADACDGVRCDMAMLVLPQIFKRTWGDRALPADGSPPVDVPFWPEAIERVRFRRPDFVMISEVYWDLEATLQTQGFDFTYDKSYYDRLRGGDPTTVRAHLTAAGDYQDRSARFLENHDEPRAAEVFDAARYAAAAVLTFTVPGLRFLHDGQLDGRRVHTSIHLARRAAESPDPVIRGFYDGLLTVLKAPAMREGRWRLLEHRAAWFENSTWRNFIGYEWSGPGEQRLWVFVNYGDMQGQCYVDPRDEALRGRPWHLRDQMSRAWFEREGDELLERGLYLDMPAWGYHVFDVTPS
jgi:glycosidase